MNTGIGKYPPIGDYAIIGDCRSAALISREGSIDWLCWPRFDSPSLFAALLDPGRGGCFAVCPVGPFRTERRYIQDTNAVETIFHSAQGSMALRDVMAITPQEQQQDVLAADHEVLREVEGLSGEIEVGIHYAPRPGYARQAGSLEPRGKLGIRCMVERGEMILRSEVPLVVTTDQRSAHGRVRIRAGERRMLALAYSDDGPAVIPTLGAAAQDRFARTIAWWQAWAGRCTYDGPYRGAVVRSVLTLKLMCYAPSGAVIAAPTTSLPEVVGGDRNWDYRYCWLRDASITVRALQELGYTDDAAAYCSWLLHATRLSWPELQVLYDVYGEPRLPETTLPHLAGYAGSRPVRIGNGAYGQRQLDVYGEVVDAVARLAKDRGFFDRDTVRFLDGLGRTVCEQWRQPDAGIWEGRDAPQHYTYSKVLCWVALDRLVTLHRHFGLALDVERFAQERDAIRETVEARGYNESLGSYTQVFDRDTLDASLLTLPRYGYIDAGHPRMVSTTRRIRERLGRGALVYRYAESTDDGSIASEGAFGICSFWAVDTLAQRGAVAEATRAFEALLGYANDLGLYAEETDPDTGAALGNFPQAFTHVGLINAALSLDEALRGTSRRESARSGTGKVGI